MIGRRYVSDESGSRPPLPARVQRTLELVYEVEGVLAARVWEWPGGVAVGVRVGHGTAPHDLLKRVEAAVVGLREPGEAWDFGLLDEAQHGAQQT